MKRLFLLVLLLSIIIPSIVYAQDSCDSSQIQILSAELDQLTGEAVEEETVHVEDGKIKLNVKFLSVGDSLQYRVVVQNHSNEDFYFDENTIQDQSGFVEYQFSYDDGSNIIKKKSQKAVTIQMTYSHEITEDNYQSNDTVVIPLTNEDAHITNPATRNNLLIYIIMIIFALSLSYLLFGDKISHYMILFILLVVIPLGVSALCKVELEMDCDITIEKRYTGYAYLYNEMGGAQIGDLLNIERKSFWCLISNEDENYYCALSYGDDTKEECLAYRDQYMTNPSEYSCVKRDRLYDDKLLFTELEEIPYYRAYFIKIYVDDGILSDAYVCLKMNNQEYCMKGADGGEAFLANREILINHQSHFTSCVFDETKANCHGGDNLINFATADHLGNAYAGNDRGGFCHVLEDKTVACGD